MSLMQSIRTFEPPEGAVGIWWLGQSGYIFKSPRGTTVGVDLYLTDSCNGLNPAVDLSRKVPVLIQPAELEIDLFAATHNHQDHTDPETVRGVPKGRTTFLGPHPSCEVFRAEGVPESGIVPAWPGSSIRFRDVTVHGTFALPTDDTDLNHMGFVFDFDGGPKVWVTGDTDWCDVLASAARHEPDLMIVCINGNFNNLSHWEAAQLASRVKPRAAMPCHYGLFPDNSVDPAQFRAALRLQAPDVNYLEMKADGTPLTFASEPRP